MHSCIGDDVTITLSFTTSQGVRTFDVDEGCSNVRLAGSAPTAPTLDFSGTFATEVNHLNGLSRDGVVQLALTSAAGARGAEPSPLFAGIVTVTRSGKPVRTVVLTSGHSAYPRLAPGNYAFAATSAGKKCVTATSQVDSRTESLVAITCSPLTRQVP
jgi:hypothetical protein